MSYILEYSERAKEDIREYKRSGEKKLLMKIEALLGEIKEHPYYGTGKPEALRHDMAGYWSRRINKQHRMIYKVEEDRVIVLVVQLRQHYGDK